MPTNRRIPAIVCLSMIVSGCANQELFDNWNKTDHPESIHPDMRATDMDHCGTNCPFIWTEDFSGGLSLRADSSSSVWKTANATWVFDHTSNPDNSNPIVSWSICDRDAVTVGLCRGVMSRGKLSLVSLGGSNAKSCSAVAYFHKTIKISNVDIKLTPNVLPCEKKNPKQNDDPCNLDMSPLTDGNSELRIETVPFATLIQQYRCTSSACAPVPQSSAPDNDLYVAGIRILFRRKNGAQNYEYLNFAVDSLTLTGTQLPAGS